MASPAEILSAIQEHAKTNGFSIIPSRDINRWADEIAKNNGHCLCAVERTCPCPESIDEIRTAKDPKEARCTCTILCDERYLEAWGYNKTTQPTKVAAKRQPSEGGAYEFKNPKLKAFVDTLLSARKNIEKGELEEAATKLRDESENNDCGTCRMFVGLEARRVSFLSTACEEFPDLCERETAMTTGMIDNLIDFYKKVDQQIDNESEPAPAVPAPPGQKVYKSEYHACLGGTLKDPTVQALPDRRERFCIAQQVCTGRAATLEEAKSTCSIQSYQKKANLNG